ncbi:translation initiation factor IF-2-like [Penaeus monodon]|uniref:translation initiation factor IF-2-like n=1 Tax=Penaeus monodon TaxID=6687 RepID=UPI0018A7AFCD|nr:translation initiation factor IF-2-like [Penaeus monodon]
MRMLLALLSAAAASLVPGALAVPGERSAVMGDLHWCSTLCLCHKGMEMQCFDRSQIYSLLQISSHYAMKLERAKWLLEERVHWCNDLCLCHTGNNKEFQCIAESKLEEFIGESVDGALLYSTRPREEEEAAAEAEVDQQEEAEAEHRRRSEERKRKRQRKNKKRVKEDEDEEEEALEDTAASAHTSSPPREDAPAAHTTTPLPTAAQPSPAEPEGDAELLPKQEASPPAPPDRHAAAHASPAVPAHAARHPCLARLHARGRQPRAGGVGREGGARRAQDGGAGGVAGPGRTGQRRHGAVMQIRSDVVLNQRILLVTVAVAGIAMLGVLILAVHSCARRRQMAAEEKQARDQPKDDHHVTKINREEEW